MPRLSARDFDALQGTILALYAHRDTAAFRHEVPDLFLKIIPADYFGLADLRVDVPRKRINVVDHWESKPRITHDTYLRMERFGFDHPFTQYALEHGDPTALKFSDFYSMRQLRGLPMYTEFYRHVDIGRLLALPSFSGPGMATLNLSRLDRERDFTERDRLILNLIRPHFDQALRNAERVTALKAPAAKSLEPYDLTVREIEIGWWLAEGKTNSEIAVILHLGVRTVEKHVESILRKLAVENRTAAAVALATANGHRRGKPPRID